ncbi:asparaginase [Dactylosporangium sp. McL0621]|uniref:asparaginase n=1 Tax=Dactylosporangium sp. McL0621 TaxID=3415678 RepID=UPI003CEDBB7B
MSRRVLLLATKDTIAYRTGSVATGAELLAAARATDTDAAREVEASPRPDAPHGLDAISETDSARGDTTHGLDAISGTDSARGDAPHGLDAISETDSARGDAPHGLDAISETGSARGDTTHGLDSTSGTDAARGTDAYPEDDSAGGVDVVVEDVLAEPGWDASPATMAATARRVRAALGEEGFHGVVVTHGADTIEEAAYLTDLVAGAAAALGAIVYTAALLPLDDPDSDGPGNLAAALTAAADPALTGLGAVACLGGELHAARWVRQAATSGPGAFTSAPYAPLGHVTGGRITLTGTPPLRPPSPPGEPETNVALIRVYPGIEPTLLTAATDAGARGIVLEGTGALNVPVSLLAAITDLVAWDIPVVITSRAHATAPPRPPDGLAASVGAILAPGLTAGKALAALMVALGAEGGVAAARDYFARG